MWQAFFSRLPDPFRIENPLPGKKSGSRYTGRRLGPDATRGPENAFLKTYKGYAYESQKTLHGVGKIALLGGDLCITRRCEESFDKLRTGSDEAVIYPQPSCPEGVSSPLAWGQIAINFIGLNNDRNETTC